MRGWITAVAVAVGMSLFAIGAQANCGKCGADDKEAPKHEWCKKCGETDKDKCCKEAEKCEACGYHKGSPGCQHECGENED